MRVISIELKGFKGFRAGLGLGEVSIDFSNLPDGLIAVVGKNGLGKTTLLDNLHPYRIMPYKLRESKEWTTGSFNYYDQCYGRDAKKEFVFELDGFRYKSTILIDAEKRKQEAYLFKEAAGAWKPFNAAVKDGKTGPYDAAVEELVGTPSLFFSSLFRSQDARKLSSYPRSEILSIVCELLNIDHIKAQGEKATKTANALGNLVEDLERQKAPILSALENKESLETQRVQTEFQINQQESTLATIKAEVTTAEKKVHELELANAAQTVTRQRVDEMVKRHDGLQSDITSLEADLTVRDSEFQAESSQIDTSLLQVEQTSKQDMDALSVEEKQEEATSKVQLDGITAKKQAAQAIIDRSDEITQAVARDQELELQIGTTRTQLDAARVAVNSLNPRIAELTTLKAGISKSIEQDLEHVTSLVENLTIEEQREKATANEEITTISSKKQSIQGILARVDEINQASARGLEIDSALETEQTRLEELRCSLTSLRVKAAELSSVDNELKSATTRLENLHRQADGMKGLDCHEDGSKTVNKSCSLLANAVAAEEQIPTVELEIQQLEAKQQELVSIRQQMTQVEQDGIALAGQVASLTEEQTKVREVSRLIFELDSATARLAELEEQEKTISTRLELRLTDIASKLEDARNRSSEQRAELRDQFKKAEDELSAVRPLLEKAESDADVITTQLATMESELADVRQIGRLIFELDLAGTRITELATNAEAVTVRLGQRIADINRRRQEVSQRSKERMEELSNQRQKSCRNHETVKLQIENKIGALAKEADALAREIKTLDSTLNGEMDKEITALNETIIFKNGEVTDVEHALKKLHATMGSIQGQIADIAKKRDGLNLIETEISIIKEEIVNWIILAKACSNDGIVALELDDAGPSIASVANDLLHACYGPRFSVRLETQATKNDGGLKETFDITVFDAERDEVKSIRDMSGGEVTYIEDAITRAFCIYNLHRSDRKFETMYTDEKDGALDPDRKHEFLAIKQQALQVGTHTREFFITQTPELYEQADARILLQPGSVQIMLR
jgi:exonuclease SbcC